MKKILISLFVCVVGFINFGNCENMYEFSRTSFSLSEGSSFNFDSGTCIVGTNYGTELSFYNSNGDFVFTGVNGSVNRLFCLDFDGYILSSSTTSRTYSYYSGFSNLFDFSCPECQECPLIDTNYCVGNGLCPNECGSGTDLSGDLQYSNLYINSILHPATQNIFVDIPDYITWDYTTTGDDFNIFVGSGYDQDYINSIIDINSYRPDSQDFTNIFVSGLTLVMPYIVIVLFIIFVWKLLKRIFK